jgi:hypothetical protein
MALTGTGIVLGDSIKAAVDAIPESQRGDRVKLFEEMGKAIIAHIIANGANAVQITSQPVTVTSVGGVLTGFNNSGPGTGTCSGVGNLV